VTARKHPCPKGLSVAGKALWDDVSAAFELAEHELALLRQACSTLDSITRLQDALDADEVMDTSPQGRRVHPALPEIRQQRIVFARLVAQLGIPAGDEDAQDEKPVTHQRRATRGVYAVGKSA